MEGISIGTVISVFRMVLCRIRVRATAQDRSPARETEISVAVKLTVSDCPSARENFRLPITAPTSTVAIVDSIRTSGRMIAKSQKMHSRIFRLPDILHFFPFMRPPFRPRPMNGQTESGS